MNEQRKEVSDIADDAPSQTFGMKAVGINFNPGGNPKVNEIKQSFADAIDKINDLRTTTEDPEVKRMCSIAITDAQAAQMWAVKAVTW